MANILIFGAMEMLSLKGLGQIGPKRETRLAGGTLVQPAALALPTGPGNGYLENLPGLTSMPTTADRAGLAENTTLDHFLAAVERKAFRMARLAVGGNTEDGLDLVQDTMLAFVRNYADYPESSWRPLFFRVLQNRIKDWHRRRVVRSRWLGWLPGWSAGPGEEEREDPLQQVPDRKRPGPAAILEGQETMATLEAALQNLPVRQQQAFLLRAWEEMSVAETAKAMSCSEGSVKSHYSRALRNLRRQLGEYWP